MSGGKPQARAIMEVVARRHGLTLSALRAHDRSHHISRARHEAMYRVRQKTGLSLPAIGRLFLRDHTSVLHGIRRWENHWSKQ